MTTGDLRSRNYILAFFNIFTVMLIYYFGFPNHRITLLSLELLLWINVCVKTLCLRNYRLNLCWPFRVKTHFNTTKLLGYQRLKISSKWKPSAEVLVLVLYRHIAAGWRGNPCEVLAAHLLVCNMQQDAIRARFNWWSDGAVWSQIQLPRMRVTYRRAHTILRHFLRYIISR